MWSVFQDFVRETDFDEYIVPYVKKVVKGNKNAFICNTIF